MSKILSRQFTQLPALQALWTRYNSCMGQQIKRIPRTEIGKRLTLESIQDILYGTDYQLNTLDTGEEIIVGTRTDVENPLNRFAHTNNEYLFPLAVTTYVNVWEHGLGVLHITTPNRGRPGSRIKVTVICAVPEKNDKFVGLGLLGPTVNFTNASIYINQIEQLMRNVQETHNTDFTDYSPLFELIRAISHPTSADNS